MEPPWSLSTLSLVVGRLSPLLAWIKVTYFCWGRLSSFCLSRNYTLHLRLLIFLLAILIPACASSSFTFIKRLFSSSLSAIKVVSSTYLRLLIFLPAILISACASSSPVFLIMYSACKLNKQGDNIQTWCPPFPIWNQSVVPCPVLTVASWPAYRFLKRQVLNQVPDYSVSVIYLLDFHSSSAVKNLSTMQETRIWSLGWVDPLEENWQPTPVFLLGKSHGQKSLEGQSPWCRKESDVTEWLSMSNIFTNDNITIFPFDDNSLSFNTSSKNIMVVNVFACYCSRCFIH